MAPRWYTVALTHIVVVVMVVVMVKPLIYHHAVVVTVVVTVDGYGGGVRLLTILFEKTLDAHNEGSDK